MQTKIVNRLEMLVVAFLSFLSATAYDFEVDGICYNVLSASDLTCEVTKNPDRYSGNIVIPSSAEFKNRMFSVVGIGDNAFRECTKLTSIELPNSVTKIGVYAFYECTSLTSIELSNSITEIGDYAFNSCRSLTSIELPNSVTKIGMYAFYECTSLTSIELPNSITEIEGYAFKSCRFLTSIELPNSITEIGNGAFSGCSSLTSIELPNSITRIRSDAFSGCSSLTSIELPNSVIELGDRVFSDCKSLKSLTIPASVESLGDSALDFRGCDNLKTLNILSQAIRYSGCYFYLPSPSSIESIYWNSPCFPRNCNLKNHVISSFTVGESCIDLGTIFDKLNKNSVINLTIEEGEDLYIDLGQYVSTWPLEYLSLNRSREIYSKDAFGYGNPNYLHFQPKQLVLGENITDASIIGTDNIVYLESKAMLPPKIREFSQMQYIDLEPVVPAAAIEAYREAPVWKEFWNLKADVVDIAADAPKTVVGTYDLNGMPVTDDYHGISIVKYTDGTTKKVVTKR